MSNTNTSSPAVHYASLTRMYELAPINQFFHPSIQIEEGAATIRMSVRPDMHHAARAAHGAVSFKMLDDAAFFAAQSAVTDAFLLTSTFTIHFLAPVTRGEMVATGRLVHRAKRVLLADAAVEVDGTVVARGSGSFVRSSIPLDARLGYVDGDPETPG